MPGPVEGIDAVGDALTARPVAVGGKDGSGNAQALLTETDGTLNVQFPPGASATEVQGTAADGAAAVGNPVQIAGKDPSGNVQALLVGTDGKLSIQLLADADIVLTANDEIAVSGKAADGAAVDGNPVLIAGQDGTNAQTLKTDSDGHPQVDVLTSALPAGGATSALQTSSEAILTTIDVDTGVIAVDTTSIDGKITACNTGAVTISAELPAGTQNIGDVDVASLPAETHSEDYDTGAGTDTTLAFGIALPKSGGAVAGGTATDPLRTDPTGATTQPVSAASLPLPSGAATAALQTSSEAILTTIDTDTGVIAGGTTSIDGKITACNTGAVVLATGSAAIGKLAANSGVDIGDVDVLSSALPTGAATSANQTTANTALAAIETAVELLDNAVSGAAFATKRFITHKAYLHNSAAPGANTDIISEVTPAVNGSLFRVSVVLETSSIFNVISTDSAVEEKLALNGATGALDAGKLYTFEVPMHTDGTYNCQVETDGGIRYLQVDEVYA